MHGVPEEPRQMRIVHALVGQLDLVIVRIAGVEAPAIDDLEPEALAELPTGQHVVVLEARYHRDLGVEGQPAKLRQVEFGLGAARLRYRLLQVVQVPARAGEEFNRV